MSLILGVEPQESPLIPSLLIFRSVFTNQRLRNHLVERTGDSDLMLRDFVRELQEATGEYSLRNVAGYITSKFNRFISDLTLRNILCQNHSLDFDEIIQNGRVVLCYLGKGRFGEQAASLLASQMISRLRLAILKRGFGQNLRPVYAYVDEFQFIADERFAELLAEGRKFGLSLTVSHQFLQQMPERVGEAILGNVGTTILFRTGAPDAGRLAGIVEPHFSQQDLISLPNFRACVRSDGRLGQTPFTIEIPPPPGPGDPAFAEELKQLSRLKYYSGRQNLDRKMC